MFFREKDKEGSLFHSQVNYSKLKREIFTQNEMFEWGFITQHCQHCSLLPQFSAFFLFRNAARKWKIPWQASHWTVYAIKSIFTCLTIKQGGMKRAKVKSSNSNPEFFTSVWICKVILVHGQNWLKVWNFIIIIFNNPNSNPTKCWL